MNNSRETKRNLIKWDVNVLSQKKQAWKGSMERKHVGGGVACVLP